MKNTCRYQELDHTADVGLHVQAPSAAALFACAAQGMFYLLGASANHKAPATRQTITVSAPTSDDLLVDWLNELLFLHETTHELYTSFQVTSWSPTELTATITGYPLLTPPRRHIKAVTYHQLALIEQTNGWVAHVYFDI